MARRTTRRPGPSRAGEFYFPKAIDNSRLVKSADPRERREQRMLIVVSLLLGALVLAAAYQRFAIIQAGYRVEALKIQRDQLQESNRQLRLEEASLRSPDRVDAIARNELGMGLPGVGQVVKLEPPVPQADRAVLARVSTPAIAANLRSVP